MPLGDFITGPRRTALGAGEILTAILIPERGLAGSSLFLKLGARAHLVISITMAAARVRVAAGRLAEVVLAIGACAPTARRLRAIETRLIGLTPTEAARQITPPALAPHVAPLDDFRASAAYRVEAGAEILRRALVEAAG